MSVFAPAVPVYVCVCVCVLGVFREHPEILWDDSKWDDRPDFTHTLAFSKF